MDHRLGLISADALSEDVDNGADAVLSVKKRRKLWEIEPHYHCSIIGTCLMPPELIRIARQARASFKPGARDYQLHSFFVEQAGKSEKVGRVMNKLMDTKFAGAIRRVGRETDARAFMSASHVPKWLAIHVFGDVHMLSHFMGGHNRQHVKGLWLAERRAEQLVERLTKSRRQAQETATDKDRRIAELEAELKETRMQLASASERAVRQPARPPSVRRLEREVTRRERRLSSTRARTRVLERDNQRLRGLLQALAEEETQPPTPKEQRSAEVPAASPKGIDGLEGRRLLYVGGRCQLVPFLRRHAEACRACLLHHDGGEEQTLQSLEAMVDRADIVFCPVDCVSHQACLKAKLLCRRSSKLFVPLRSSSSSSFLRALQRRQECGS